MSCDAVATKPIVERLFLHGQEWRHAYGMKCLGIPNTKPFHGITLIEDAYTLWAKLKVCHGCLLHRHTPWVRRNQSWVGRHSSCRLCCASVVLLRSKLIGPSFCTHVQVEQGGGDFNPELDEEFEDRAGNVMNRKTYTDLARQGLLD